MEKETTIDRVLSTMGITDDHIDLIDRFLSLEKDKNRVNYVELKLSCSLCYFRLITRICLLKDFQDITEFREYLSINGLPTEMIHEEMIHEGTYLGKKSYYLEKDLIQFIFFVSREKKWNPAPWVGTI